MIKVTLLNHEGEGFAQTFELQENTAMQDFFREQMGMQGERYVNDYAIRVNREPVEAEYSLQDGDKITITPTKIRGASHPLHSIR